jgi:hypothetical protein
MQYVRKAFAFSGAACGTDRSRLVSNATGKRVIKDAAVPRPPSRNSCSASSIPSCCPRTRPADRAGAASIEARAMEVPSPQFDEEPEDEVPMLNVWDSASFNRWSRSIRQ